mmetsp:Transcript_17437/g.30178  ORF Transcript_17437/g.30178 Transcript_17437/m.30178 type:complete len:98 (-) Transcript_17437:2148-2441(-)
MTGGQWRAFAAHRGQQLAAGITTPSYAIAALTSPARRKQTHTPLTKEAYWPQQGKEMDIHGQQPNMYTTPDMRLKDYRSPALCHCCHGSEMRSRESG